VRYGIHFIYYGEVMMKHILESKTFWANLISLVALGLSVSGHGIPDSIATPEAQAQAVVAIMGVSNIVLRAITTEPVKVI